MKDFADIDNAVGSFPSVTATDASGPGETDSFALVADYFNQHLGWIQALMNEAGLTPSGSDEVYNNSQILNAIKLMFANRQPCPIINGQPLIDNTSQLPDWIYDDADWKSKVNDGVIEFALDPPRNLSVDVTITISLNPGSARSTGNRMTCRVWRQQQGGYTAVTASSEVEDDGTTASQSVEVTISGYTFYNNSAYVLRVTAGNDGATNQDSVYSIQQDYEIP